MSEPLQKILYVEDDTDIQEVVRISLEAVGGFDVLICSSGVAALEHGPAFSPDLILLDMMMPVMDGPTTFREMRKIAEFKDTPVVFMTAKVQPGEISSYLELGAFDVVPKPFDPMVLPDRLRAIWERFHE